MTIVESVQKNTLVKVNLSELIILSYNLAPSNAPHSSSRGIVQTVLTGATLLLAHSNFVVTDE